MDLGFIPYQGVGPLKLEMTTTEIEKLLSPYECDHSQYKNGKDTIVKDYYAELDLIVYAKNKRTEYFEFFDDPEVRPTVTFNGLDLLSTSYNKLLDLFLKLDTNLIKDFDAFYCMGLGITVSVPKSEDLDDTPSSILIFAKGQYDGIKLPLKPEK